MPGRSWCQTAWSLGLCLSLLACGSKDQQEGWTIYPLQRNEPHDGLAVVNPVSYTHLTLPTKVYV